MTLRQFLAVARTTVPRVTPAACFERLRTGKALLVDVRERKEWEKGFAQSAFLLPLSALARSRVDWKALRQTAGAKQLILYCGAGVRSNLGARILHVEGFLAVNGGALHEWIDAGWPLSRPD